VGFLSADALAFRAAIANNRSPEKQSKGIRMTDDEIRARGWSVPIYRAVAAAGGPIAVAHHFKLAAMTTPMRWYKTGRIGSQYIVPLCALGGNAVQPDEILRAVSANPTLAA